MTSSITKRLEAAQTIVKHAAKIAMDMRPPPGGPTGKLKQMQDWVTEADGAVENFIGEQIKNLFPDDGFQGEENGQTRSGALRWVVDPIDGTSNYGRGRNRWCISLGLMDGDTPVGGIIEAPIQHETYYAQKGKGAFLNGARISASTVTDPSTAMFEMGWSPYTTTKTYLEKMQAMLELGAMPRSSGSGALALADVASGRLDGYLEIVINLWDVAAALVLLEEAGARVTPFIQHGGLERGISILAAAPGVAEQLGNALGYSF
ncbi:inositol monophosphatase family protein [Entomobacter blattae]|uniref:Inositol monophosphatase family protein n=1 Tax=Entomobacter blattae TaxID=2762277 RepID=A0A7H1NPB1_9PROT|nr:inositol monophosphatase family protein [Entomobacter blattae]QNT77621.1 Inositol monophosphatase family protein [Entomobacter blattae]